MSAIKTIRNDSYANKINLSSDQRRQQPKSANHSHLRSVNRPHERAQDYFTEAAGMANGLSTAAARSEEQH